MTPVVYFESEILVFSLFAITGYVEEKLAVQEISTFNQTVEAEQSDAPAGIGENNEQSAVEDKNTPSLSFGFVTMLVACAALFVRKRC